MSRENIFNVMENDIMQANIPETEKNKMLKNVMKLKEQKIKKLLLIATGALMNSTTSQQGESIPSIAHAISIEL